jgi:hypothetical protein
MHDQRVKKLMFTKKYKTSFKMDNQLIEELLHKEKMEQLEKLGKVQNNILVDEEEKKEEAKEDGPRIPISKDQSILEESNESIYSKSGQSNCSPANKEILKRRREDNRSKRRNNRAMSVGGDQIYN